MPWKTIDILSDWAANSKSQLDLLKSESKLTCFKNRGKKRERAREGGWGKDLISANGQDRLSEGTDAIKGQGTSLYSICTGHTLCFDALDVSILLATQLTRDIFLL